MHKLYQYTSWHLMEEIIFSAHVVESSWFIQLMFVFILALGALFNLALLDVLFK